MNSKFYIKYSATNSTFFLEGKGFCAYEIAKATVFPTAQAAQAKIDCIRSVGISGGIVHEVKAPISFAVVYIRKGDVTATGQVAKQTPNAALGQTDPSSRRFASFEEAVAHGSRFYARKANAGDKPGTAGHRGFFVIETNDPVNAKVNPLTGLTNSL